MKRNSIAVLALVLVVAFAGCSKSSDSAKTKVQETDVKFFKYDLSKDGKGIVITDYTVDNPLPVVIPAKIEDMPVVEIGKEPFRNKKFVPSVTIPSTVTKIGDSAFMGSSIQSVNIPDGVTEIGSIAFSGTNLKSIYMPDSVTKIVGDNWGGVFGNCIYLTEVRLSDNLTVIPNQMFKDSKTLYKVNLPKNLKEIGGTAFWNCGNLTELTIPESLTSLKFTGDDSDSNNAFGGCGKLPIKTRQRLQELGYKGKWSF